MRANTLDWPCTLQWPGTLKWTTTLNGPAALDRRTARLLALLAPARLLTLILLRLRLVGFGRRLRVRRCHPKQNRRGRYRLRPECNFIHKA